MIYTDDIRHAPSRSVLKHGAHLKRSRYFCLYVLRLSLQDLHQKVVIKIILLFLNVMRVGYRTRQAPLD
jgi:hypothetical protein